MKSKHSKPASVPPATAIPPAAERTAPTDQAEVTPTPSPAGQPGPASISPTELDQLKTAAAKADENWDKFLRAAAELDNYRKRVAREKEDLARFTSERVVAALLPVLDNLERALAAVQEHETSSDAILDGLQQIQSQFRRTLEEFGLKEVAAHAGHPFDPNIHEAVGHVESAEHPEGHVIEQLQRGYKLADRLLRPARVVVSKGPAQKGSSDAGRKNSGGTGVPAGESE
ncbi:MAG TPA: nucleotide exchange factor GrpE [Verrucomicrobiae bacterium]|nr:nucleotide exchange factor GrpE [Verrucomicrobiae bacterium]